LNAVGALIVLQGVQEQQMSIF